MNGEIILLSIIVICHDGEFQSFTRFTVWITVQDVDVLNLEFG